MQWNCQGKCGLSVKTSFRLNVMLLIATVQLSKWKPFNQLEFFFLHKTDFYNHWSTIWNVRFCVIFTNHVRDQTYYDVWILVLFSILTKSKTLKSHSFFTENLQNLEIDEHAMEISLVSLIFFSVLKIRWIRTNRETKRGKNKREWEKRR